jgi:tyrosine ammonia-lyase
MEFHPQRPFPPESVAAVARAGERLTLHGDAWAAVAASHDQLRRLQAEGRRVYGLTTGFGPLATTRVGGGTEAEHQRNLIYHLATGTGSPLERPKARAVLTTRILSLARGYSGIRPAALELLLECLNRDLIPAIPERGTVGASGDLTPLAHLALAVMGEGAMLDGSGTRDAAEQLAAAGLAPLEPGGRDALAIVNGTAAMTGIAADTDTAAYRALDWATALAAVNAEAFCSPGGFVQPGLDRVRPHPGQTWARQRLADRAAGSQRLGNDPQPPPVEPVPEGQPAVWWDQPLPQAPYSVRCAPQLLGAVRDSLDFHHATVDRELASVTDNPVLDADADAVLHGGNFYGQHVAFAADTLTQALIKLGVHSDRIIARITDPARNGELPPFLQGDRTGLQSGFMGAQVSASALVGEMRTRATPAGIQSIPTNADNQDVVTMGTIGARQTAAVADLLFEILAMEALVLAQATELATGPDFSPGARALAGLVRQYSPALEQDRPLTAEIGQLAAALRERPPPRPD